MNFNVEVEISAKHVHLSQEDVNALFGEGHELTFVRELSQPGQYLSEERVSVVTEGGRLDNVAVLGPVRPSSQVEVSATDCRTLKAKAPFAQSGDLSSATEVSIEANGNSVKGNYLIIAKNHIHVSQEDGDKYGIKDGDLCSVTVGTDRKVQFHNVLLRVSDKFCTRMHIDFDEANAIGYAGTNPTGEVEVY
ncbi:MAG: phosphate propanoyltransferase [Mycoplasmatales bacterium]